MGFSVSESIGYETGIMSQRIPGYCNFSQILQCDQYHTSKLTTKFFYNLNDTAIFSYPPTKTTKVDVILTVSLLMYFIQYNIYKKN